MTKEELVIAFEQLPTGNVSDAMDDMGVVRQVIHGLYCCDPKLPRLVGWAYTLQQLRRRPDTPKENLTRQLQAVDTGAQAGDVIMYAAGGRMDVATGGSILALRAKRRGIRGFVVDGCFRDVDEIAEMDFPVYIKGASPVRSKGDLETYQLQMPVDICGVQVNPGDLIVADASGVLAIPASIAEEVCVRAKKIFENEEKMVKAIEEGLSIASYVNAPTPATGASHEL